MIRVLRGHVLDRLAELPDESIHCVVTSPPYYGLRSYQTPPQVWGGDPNCEHAWGAEGKSEQRLRNGIGSHTAKVAFGETLHPSTGAFCHCGAWRGDLGLEPQLDLYLDHIVEVFREVRRVLRSDGTCWLNIADSYSNFRSHKQGGQPPQGFHKDKNGQPKRHGQPEVRGANRMVRHVGIKEKDMMLIPSRLAIRLQDEGWWIRQVNYWVKSAPMPESCTDRSTCAVEWVIHMTKSAKYYYDQTAVAEESETDPKENYPERAKITGRGQQGFADARGNDRDKSGGFPPSPSGKRNQRNWWRLGPAPFPEAHFATFPPELPRRCILAGTSQKGVCPECGAPWARVVERNSIALRPNSNSNRGQSQSANRFIGQPQRGAMACETQTIGWRPSCQCQEIYCSVCAIVLDIAHGREETSTTAFVSDVRDDVPPVEAQCSILQPSVLSRETEHSPDTNLRAVREDDTADARNTAVLQQSLFDQMDGDAPEGISRRQDDQQSGIRADLASREIRARASRGDGGSARPPVAPNRGRSSHQRPAARQSTRKSFGDVDLSTRSTQKADIHGDVPVLPSCIPSAGQCPHCGGGLIKRTPSPEPAKILDCFLGSGTTALVADRLDRDCIGIELSSEYVDMAERRLRTDAGMFASLATD